MVDIILFSRAKQAGASRNNAVQPWHWALAHHPMTFAVFFVLLCGAWEIRSTFYKERAQEFLYLRNCVPIHKVWARFLYHISLGFASSDINRESGLNLTPSHQMTYRIYLTSRCSHLCIIVLNVYGIPDQKPFLELSNWASSLAFLGANWAAHKAGNGLFLSDFLLPRATLLSSTVICISKADSQSMEADFTFGPRMTFIQHWCTALFHWFI